MKIIAYGDPNMILIKKKQPMYFCCNNCYCKWIAFNNEYTKLTTFDSGRQTTETSCPCPTCNATIYSTTFCDKEMCERYLSEEDL